MSSKDWLLLSIITFLTVAVWTVYDIYHTAISSTITTPRAQHLEQIDPTLNEDVFTAIKKRSD